MINKDNKGKLVYICSPYKDNIKRNIEIAKKISVDVFNKGLLPLCLHSFLEDVTELKEDFDRPFIIKTCLDYLNKCDMIIVNFDSKISPGMQIEMDYAIKMGIPFLDYSGGKVIG